MTNPELNKELFEKLIDKDVKIIINDLGTPHFIRGTIKNIGDEFILIRGDYSEQIILMSTILKIVHNKKSDSHE